MSHGRLTVMVAVVMGAAMVGVGGGVSLAASPPPSVVPSPAASPGDGALPALCAAFDDLVATWYAYPFFKVDLETLSTDERRATADTYERSLADAVTRAEAAAAELGVHPMGAAGLAWATAYRDTEVALAEQFVTASTTDTFSPAFDAAAAAETAADAAFLAAVRALDADARATELPVEGCMPTFLRGEPVPGWTSPRAWKQVDKETFRRSTKWPTVDDLEAATAVVDGAYRITIRQVGRSYWRSTENFRALKRLDDLGDVRVSAAVTVPDGTVDGGVLCREADHDGYVFLVSPSAYQIRRLEGDQSVPLAERFPTTVGHAVPAGTPVTVTGECTGTGAEGDPVALTLLIDGDVVLHVVDQAPLTAPGGIGMFASSGATSTDPSVLFDDLTVSVPNG